MSWLFEKFKSILNETQAFPSICQDLDVIFLQKAKIGQKNKLNKLCFVGLLYLIENKILIF